MGKFGEWFRWAMAVLVIPLIIWGIKLEVNRAVMEERVENMRQEHATSFSRLETGLKEAQGLNKAVQDNNGKLIELATKIDGMTSAITEIKELLRGR